MYLMFTPRLSATPANIACSNSKHGKQATTPRGLLRKPAGCSHCNYRQYIRTTCNIPVVPIHPPLHHHLSSNLNPHLVYLRQIWRSANSASWEYGLETVSASLDKKYLYVMNGKLRPKNFACSLKYRNYDKEIKQQGNIKPTILFNTIM